MSEKLLKKKTARDSKKKFLDPILEYLETMIKN